MTDTLTLFDLSDRIQIELRGADRQTFLNNFCTNDVKALQPGEGCEAFLTSIKGRILGHLIVSVDVDSLWIDSVPGSNTFIASHLEKYLITEKVEIVDRTAELGPLCLAGSQSADWLAEHAGVGDLALWGRQPAVIDGIEVVVRRVAFTPQPGFELVVAHTQRSALQNAVLVNGAEYGTLEQFETLRIEAGFPHYGIDLSEDNIAQEAGRNEQAISFKKGCYLGQEPIARLDALGHTNKELCRLRLSAGPVPTAGDAVQSLDGKDVGRITSAAMSTESATPIALAMLKTALTKPGTTVMVSSDDQTRRATVE
jgi:folate-binding protein YgfZ